MGDVFGVTLLYTTVERNHSAGLLVLSICKSYRMRPPCHKKLCTIAQSNHNTSPELRGCQLWKPFVFTQHLSLCMDRQDTVHEGQSRMMGVSTSFRNQKNFTCAFLTGRHSLNFNTMLFSADILFSG